MNRLNYRRTPAEPQLGWLERAVDQILGALWSLLAGVFGTVGRPFLRREGNRPTH